MKFSVCIPSYNRAKYLPRLLDSILAQLYNDYEIIICEDNSPERQEIRNIIISYRKNHVLARNKIIYIENDENLGYDRNIRKLIEVASGEYCFFMGNDDIMAPYALKEVNRLILSYENIGVVIKAYSYFDISHEDPIDTVRYVKNEKFMKAGREAIEFGFRRVGVISGFIVKSVNAMAAKTNKYDGTLYYQMHVAIEVMRESNLIVTPLVLVYCRADVSHDFGNSNNEKGFYLPGSELQFYSRIKMMEGIIRILDDFELKHCINIKHKVLRDYANHFYPYISEQLNITISQYLTLAISYTKMGFWRFPSFYFFIIFARLLGKKKVDYIVKYLRKTIGRTI